MQLLPHRCRGDVSAAAEPVLSVPAVMIGKGFWRVYDVIVEFNSVDGAAVGWPSP